MLAATSYAAASYRVPVPRYRYQYFALRTWVRFSCFFALLPSFLLFLRPYPGVFLLVLRRQCIQLSASAPLTTATINTRSSCVILYSAILPQVRIPLFILFIFFALIYCIVLVLTFSWLACSLCSRTRYLGIWFAARPWLIRDDLLVALSQSVNTEFVSLSYVGYVYRMKNQDGTGCTADVVG